MAAKYLQKMLMLGVFCLLFLAAMPLLVVGQVPSPESVIGFKVGEDRRLANWTQVLAYLRAVADAAPDRVTYEELGKSTLGKPFVALTISSAENMRQLDHYLRIQQRLADPRGLSDADADKLIEQGKAVVLITCTIVGDPQQSLRFCDRTDQSGRPKCAPERSKS